MRRIFKATITMIAICMIIIGSMPIAESIDYFPTENTIITSAVAEAEELSITDAMRLTMPSLKSIQEPSINAQNMMDTKEPKEHLPRFGTGREGDMGRFVIPSKNYAIPLYDDYDFGGDTQYICDMWDAAVCLHHDGPTPVIADHAYQGFDIIKTCSVGDRAYIEQAGCKTWYECVCVDPYGINAEYEQLTSDGENIRWLGSEYISCYTCNEYWQSITVVIWRECDAPMTVDLGFSHG